MSPTPAHTEREAFRTQFYDRDLHGVRPRVNLGPLTAAQIAEAIVRAAGATGELGILTHRDEAALKGLVAFRARWIALAALLALHPEAEIEVISVPLGCGSTPLRSLAGTRGQSWWDEAVVNRVFMDLAGADDALPLGNFQGLRSTVAGVVAGRMVDGSNSNSGAGA